MSENNSALIKKNDFNSGEILRLTSRHDKDIRNIKNRVSKLEERVGTDAAFAESFAASQKTSTVLNTSINEVINNHDKHLLIVKGVTLLKWLGVLTIGGLIGWILNQTFALPQHNLEMQELRSEIERLRESSSASH